MNARENYYLILGFPKDRHPKTISKEEIKKNFNKLALTEHPDKSNKPNANERFIKITEARDVLVSSTQRTIYDATFPHPVPSSDELNDKYNKLSGVKGLAQKALATVTVIGDIIRTIVSVAVTIVIAVVAMPFLIFTLWATPKWLSKTISNGRDENAFLSISKRCAITFKILAIVALSPLIALGYLIKYVSIEAPKYFKNVAVDGLTREEKGKLFTNLVVITTILLIIFPPAGIAVMLGAFGGAAIAMHISGAGIPLFGLATLITAKILSKIAEKTYDFFNSLTFSKSSPAPAQPAAQSAAQSAAAKLEIRSSPAFVARELASTAAADTQAAATVTTDDKASENRHTFANANTLQPAAVLSDDASHSSFSINARAS